MREFVGGVVLDEVEVDPLGDYALKYLMSKKKECPYLDYKLKIDVGKNSNFPEVAKDIFAFSNYGGGWILIGWKEYKSSQYGPVGVPEDYNVDQATLQEKFNSYSNYKLELGYYEFTGIIKGETKRFAAIFVPPSFEILKPIKDGKYIKGKKEKTVFKKDEVFYRRGSQSIHPSGHELDIMRKRLEKEKYRLSVLSGEPDEIEETIYSNLFPVTKLPENVFTGIKKDYDDISIKVLLKQEGVFPEFYFKFKEWSGEIVTFENLQNKNNPYRKLVETDSIKKEPLISWIENEDKNRIIVELLNRELTHYAMNMGMFHFDEQKKLYYPLFEEERRRERWKGRYRKYTRTVGSRMWAEQLKRFIYWHAAFIPRFIQLGSYEFYLRIYPTFVLTGNGKYAIKGFREGTVITRLSYNKYNSSYLNTILFWIHQLGKGKNIEIGNYLEILSEPMKIEMPVGILHDIPSSEFRLEMEEPEEDIFEEVSFFD
jgi:hypothetical protein